MAQPQVAGVWSSSASGTAAQHFVAVVRDPRWLSVTVDFLVAAEGLSGAIGGAPIGAVAIGGSAPLVLGHTETGSAGKDGVGFVSALFQAVQSHTLASHLRATLHTGAESSDEFSVTFAENEGDPWSVDLTFDDGSVATAYASDDLSDKPGVPADDPSRWLEPVEHTEYGSIESLIGQLQMVLDESDMVPDDTRLKLQGAIDVLRGSHRAVVVGETRRIELLSVAKWVFTYLRKELPVDIVTWAGAIKVVEAMYPNLAEYVRQLAS